LILHSARVLTNDRQARVLIRDTALSKVYLNE
jgi:hypothetical protein